MGFSSLYLVALFCLEKQCSGLFRGFFVAPVLGKIYARPGTVEPVGTWKLELPELLFQESCETPTAGH